MARIKIKNNISYDDARKKYYVTFNYGKNSDGKNIKTTKTFDKQKEAEKALIKFEADKINQKLVMPTKTTVKSYSEYWIKNEKRQLKKTTLYGYNKMLNNHIVPYMGDIELQKVSRTFVSQFFTYLAEEKHFSDCYVRKFYDLLKSIFKTAVEDEILFKNPMASIKPIKVPYREMQVYDEFQLNTIFKLSEGTKLEVVVKLGGYLGLRRGEICGLKWQEVDFKNRRISIVNSRTQAGKEYIEDGVKSATSIRSLEIPDGLYDILLHVKAEQEQDKKDLKELYQDGGYVICKANGVPFKPNYISDLFSEFLQNNNMPHIRLHDLRHSYGTLARNCDVSMKDISEELGHADIKTTDKLYIKPTEHTMHTGVQAVAKRIDNAKKIEDKTK